MFKNITSFTADRITDDILDFLNNENEIMYRLLNALLSFLPKKDAYSTIRLKESFFYSKPQGVPPAIMAQRAFLVSGDTIAVITFKSRMLDAALDTLKPSETFQYLRTVPSPEASDDNLKDALGDAWSLQALVNSAKKTGIVSVSNQGLDATKGNTEATYRAESYDDWKCSITLAASNPRFLQGFTAQLNEQYNKG